MARQSLARTLTTHFPDIEIVTAVESFEDPAYIWIKNANSLVLASKVEGLPNALVEASYLRIPCVTTNCASIVNRIVSEGENGYIVNYGDISDMSQKMMMALNLKKTLPIYVGATTEDVNRLFSFI